MRYLYPTKVLKEIKDYISSLKTKTENPFIGVSGQAGAGKSTLVEYLVEYMGRGQIISVDYFFKESSKDRKKRIEESKKIGEEEYLKNSNNIVWFDFPKFNGTILKLKNGEIVVLKNVYDKHTGELTKTVYLKPDLTTFVDGVFILHCLYLDSRIYIHRDPEERKRNIEKRDGHRKSKQDLEQRWMETQGTEIPYIEMFLKNADLIIDASRNYEIIRKEEISKDVIKEIVERSKDEHYSNKWEKYVKESLKEILP